MTNNKKDEELFFNPFQSLQHRPGQNKNAAKEKKPSEKSASSVAHSAANVEQGEQDVALFQEAMAGHGFKKALPDAPVTQAAIPERQKLSDLAEPDENLFVKAMQGVNPVAGRGRDLPGAIIGAAIGAVTPPGGLKDFLEDKIEFALEDSAEFFEGHVMGLDPLVVAKLKAGQYRPEAQLDLHGQKAEQALETLIAFIHQAYNKNQRFLLVITGRGINSPSGLGILRINMQEWLIQHPLKRVVLAFCTAQAKDGGAGAVYILLRRFKKSKNKIQWDRPLDGNR
jgi:DNA-nicking Smr family endonuclease